MRICMKKIIPVVISYLILISSFSIADKSIAENISLSSVEHLENMNESGLDDGREYYALIVGVEKFANLTFPEEYWIDETAIAMYDLLVNSSNWREENIKMLLNENATKNNIHDAIVNWLDEKEDENDVVLIFYTDHGWKTRLSERKYGHAFVFTYNVTEENRIEDKITDKEFDTWVDQLESKHIVIILETCYSGRMFALRQHGRVLLTAGGKYFFCGVDDSDHLKEGIFTHYIMEGLKGVADLNNDGWVTAEETFRYARPHTIYTSIWEQFPFIQKYGNSTIIWFFQVPRMYDRHVGSIPLIKLSNL